MATIERMNIIYQGKEKKGFISSMRCFNVSKPVGPGPANQYSDVMVVQALFDFLGDSRNPNHDWLDILDVKTAKVSGFFDAATEKMIRKYQSGGTYGTLGTMVADGIVHPASLDGRKMRLGGKHMIIVDLNLEAKWGAGPSFSYDLVSAMLDRYPMLKATTTDKTGGKEGAIHTPV